jgi:hypothetical protein
MKLFRACKKMTAKNQSYKEEYLLIRKRARSEERMHFEKLEKEKEAKLIIAGLMSDRRSILDDEQDPKKSIRSKSIQAKKVKLLEESIRFNMRMGIMKQRRAQFFAPAVKKLDVVQKEIDKQYEEYVFAKRIISFHPFFTEMVVSEVKKNLRYRTASTDPILR